MRKDNRHDDLRETERETDKQDTDRQTDRQTDRKVERERCKRFCNLLFIFSTDHAHPVHMVTLSIKNHMLHYGSILIT